MILKTIDRQILSIAIPAIVTNITTPLLGLMDVAITGHLGRAEYIAAIAVGGNIFNMLYWIFSFLRSGTSGITANAFGASSVTFIYATLYRALLVAMMVGGLIIVCHGPVVDIFIKWMDVTGDTATFTARYFNILVYGAPAFLATYAMSGWMIGMQDSRGAMWLSLFINLLNIVASVSLVIGLHLKIEGVAIGTLTAQWGGALFGFWLIISRFRLQPVSLSKIFEKNRLLQFFKVSRDLFFRTICLVGVTLWFTRVGASQGTLVLAANTLLMQFFMFFSYFTDGFAYAGEALCGRFAGSRDYENLRRVGRRLMLWGLAVAFVFTIIYGTGGNLLLSLLSNEHDVLVGAGEYLVWVIILPLCGFAAFVYDGIFVGVTSTGHLLISMLISAAVFFLSYILLFPWLGNHGLWIAFLLYLIARGIYLGIIFHKMKGCSSN